MAKFCPNCGTEINGGDCPKCTKPPVNNANTQSVVNTEKTNGLAIAGFVVSVVSPILCCGSLSTLGLILSIVGLVNVNKTGQKGKGLAIAGIIISAVIMVISMILALTGYITEIIDELS